MEGITLIITPKTKVGELLDAYPQLENVLFDLSPSFAKLKNPILRKTVAKVATLQQAAIVGGLKIDVLINRLRKEVGQDVLTENIEDNSIDSNSYPVWFNESNITQQFDAIPVINSGGHPMAEIMSFSNKLNTGEILELKTPFIPAPIIDILKEKGFEVFYKKNEEVVITYITK